MFPAFLDLTSRHVVVVGGGPVAASKLESLLAAGARVTVVAPDIHQDIERAGVEIVRREFRDDGSGRGVVGRRRGAAGGQSPGECGGRSAPHVRQRR